MSGIWEILCVLLAAAGVLALGWFWFGHLVTPLPPQRTHTVVSALGNGGDLERTVRGLLWLRGSGCSCGDIVIADLGLDEEGLTLAKKLMEENTDIVLCSAGALDDLLRQEYIGGE